MKDYNILVIDDEVSIRESLKAFLEDYDYIVDSANSAEEALEMLESNSYDLAVVDMRLPGESGDAFIIQAHERFQELRFLIHTGSVEFQLTEGLRQLGMTPEHVYLKPLHDISILAEGIAKQLEQQG